MPAKRRSARSIGSSNITASIKVAEIIVRFFCISASKLIRINLCSDSVNTNRKVMISYSCISGFNSPKRLWKTSYSSRRIEHNFSPIKSKTLPMQRMMPSITYIDADFSKLCRKNRMSCLSFDIISRLIKISNSGNM